jgi:hypothetical protein
MAFDKDFEKTLVDYSTPAGSVFWISDGQRKDNVFLKSGS